MTDDGSGGLALDDLEDGAPVAYETPTIQRLGTLAELTQGGGAGPADGIMGYFEDP